MDFGTGQSGLPNRFTFDGAGSDPSAAVGAFSGIAPGQIFNIGKFTYYNGSTSIGTAIDAVTLSITLSLTDPADANPATSTYNYNFAIDLTPNLTGNAVTDGEIVTISNGVTASTFTSGGTNYTLGLIGFSTDNGTTFTSQFLSPEGSTAVANIYAEINEPDQIAAAAVPEPGTLGLLASALVGLGFWRWRRRVAL